MSILSHASRPLIASMFVYGGLDAARHPASKVGKAVAVTGPLTDAAGVAVDPHDLVRLNGVIQVGAGLALAAGRAPRTCAAILAGSLVVTTIAGHRFWEETDPKARAQQTIQFLKNASMLGGLLAVIDRG